jgi:heme a synthase
MLNSEMKSEKYHPWLHRIAVITAGATFLLILMGGRVTSRQAGLAVPDWPNSFGYNMFLFPPSKWIGGIYYEHTHRLMATVVGMLSIVLAIGAWLCEERAWARRLAYSVLGAVIFQGVLGGLRVVWVNLDLAIVHACVAQAFFCLAALVAIITSRWWINAPAPAARRLRLRSRPRVFPLACLTFSIIYLQLIAGALMRHHEAGLAIPDVPFAYGHVLPPTTTAELDQINQLRAWKLDLPPVTLTQIGFHYAHRMGALLVSISATLLIGVIVLRHRDSALFTPALLLFVLLITQITLGLATVMKRKPADLASAYVAVGALCLVTAFTIAVRAFRLYARSDAGSASADAIAQCPSAEAEAAPNFRPQPA